MHFWYGEKSQYENSYHNMLLQIDVDRLILSLNIKLNIKIKGLNKTPFKMLPVLHCT